MRRNLMPSMVLAAALGIFPGIGLYGTALYLGRNNWVSIERAATLIQLYNMETFEGTDALRRYATEILETYDSSMERFRHKGAVGAAAEYLQSGNR